MTVTKLGELSVKPNKIKNVREEDVKEALLFWCSRSVDDNKKVWGEMSLKKILKKYSFAEFVNKYKEYIQKKEEENKEIKVGDYVEFYSGLGSTTIMVVTNILTDGYYDGIDFDGKTYTVAKGALLKTGKHCDIGSILNQLK